MFGYIRCNRGLFPQMFITFVVIEGHSHKCLVTFVVIEGHSHKCLVTFVVIEGCAMTAVSPFQVLLQKPFSANRVWMYQ